MQGKRIGSVYEPGERSGAWIKHRTNREQEFVIGGYIPGAHGFDALLVGVYENNGLVFVAKVKDGFVPRIRDEVFPTLKTLTSARCPFKNRPEKGSSLWGESLTAEKMNQCRWVKPKLVCQIAFVEWTDAGHLRHCTFVAIRDDKRSAEVVAKLELAKPEGKKQHLDDMPGNNHRNTEATPPHAQLIQMALAFWTSRIVYVAAKLGLADHLSNGSKSADELAGETGTHAPSLYRVMRTLASLGILTEEDGGTHQFALTPLGEALQSGALGSAHATILTLAGDLAWRGWEHMLYSVETGKSGYEKSLGMPMFDWLAKNPRDASLFSETMIGFHGAEPAAVAAAYDFSGLTTIVDVGGATGNLLTTILGSQPRTRGILFDLPHVVSDAPALIQARGLTERVTIESGSFFESVPIGGDAYLLSHIIHDWSEEQCLTILGNCRRAMNPDSRLLIVEMVLPDGNTPHPGKILDIVMLVAPGGQERTEREYGALLEKAGLRLRRVVPTESAVSVVEAGLA
jgi:hypothetical protein